MRWGHYISYKKVDIAFGHKTFFLNYGLAFLFFLGLLLLILEGNERKMWNV